MVSSTLPLLPHSLFPDPGRYIGRGGAWEEGASGRSLGVLGSRLGSPLVAAAADQNRYQGNNGVGSCKGVFFFQADFAIDEENKGLGGLIYVGAPTCHNQFESVSLGLFGRLLFSPGI